MLDIKHWTTSLSKLWFGLKTERLQWRVDHQQHHLQLKQQQALAEATLLAELTTRRVQLEHRLALLKTEQATELDMLKTKCQQDLKDYQQYLAALDQLKTSIQRSYTQLPEVIAFTIHHHAKQLLNALWEAKSMEDKLHHEMHLIRFMTTVHEEVRLFVSGESVQPMPEKTLQLIQSPK